MNYLPIFIDVRDHRIVVAGGGALALSKLRTVLKSVASVCVIAPVVSDELHVASGAIQIYERRPTRADLAGARLVYIANDDIAENRHVAMLCRELGILVNSADNAAASDFISPAIVDRDPVVVAIGSEGTAPLLVRQIKARIEALLDGNTGAMARLAASLRPRVRTCLEPRARRTFWRKFFSGLGGRLLARHGAGGARRVLHDVLGRQVVASDQPGHVSIVGAGPGDPDLLTLKARRLLDRADVVLFDRLVAQPIVDLVRCEAQQIEVGKTPGGTSWRQEDINTALVEAARKGHHVVRLKSGDPMVFGRTDEEIEALQAAGISYEIVPGITSATAAAARIEASLTRRGRNSALNFITGQDTRGYAEQDWRALAAPGAVSAIYMGVRAARFVQGRLLLHGADEATPVTVIENASRPDERVLTIHLGELAEQMARQNIAGPAIILLGLTERRSANQATGSFDHTLPPSLSQFPALMEVG